MKTKPIFGFRGDGRDPKKLKAHGGFVPKYLLEDHKGGFDGFIACPRKVEGQIGCRCVGFTGVSLFDKAKKAFLELMKKPINLQTHVIFNTSGYISTAIKVDDAYFGHNYKVQSSLIELSITEAVKKYQPTGKILPLVKNWKVYINREKLEQATLIAVTPHGGVELTFITPILYKYLTYIGKK